ncbi:hypothetical protein KTF23_12590, partial [Burkholderia multivorans]|uniref:hypothetical protein n=1 Tax=Burkholderia multivorans TaxID=87883 RepID=UPI001C237CEB
VHNSSSMIGLAISSVSVVPMPEVNSSPRKLTAPRGLFETVSKGFAHLDGVEPGKATIELGEDARHWRGEAKRPNSDADAAPDRQSAINLARKFLS